MARTLLEMVQQACGEIGIPQPAFLFGSQSDQERQIIALAMREGADFARVANKNGGWQNLRKDGGFTTVANQPAYNFPADFSYFIQKTFFDNQYKWELLGPISAQERQILRYGVVASGPRAKFYIQGTKIILDPVPTQSGIQVPFMYLSSYWCADANGTPKARWTADTDIYLLDEECFIAGLKWRYLAAKKFDYGEEFNTYEMEKQRTISRDGGSRDLSINGGGYGVQFLDQDNVPDTGFGGVSA